MDDTHALDDDLPDTFNNWLVEQDPTNIIRYAKDWHKVISEKETVGDDEHLVTPDAKEVKEFKEVYTEVPFTKSNIDTTGIPPKQKPSEWIENEVNKYSTYGYTTHPNLHVNAIIEYLDLMEGQKGDIQNHRHNSQGFVFFKRADE